MIRVARIGVLAALLGVVLAVPAVAARGMLDVKVQVNSAAAFRHPAVLYRVNHTGHRARYYVTTTGWTGGKTLNPKRVTVTIKLAKGEGAVYAGTLAHLPNAGPLFCRQPPSGRIDHRARVRDRAERVRPARARAHDHARDHAEPPLERPAGHGRASPTAIARRNHRSSSNMRSRVHLVNQETLRA